MTTEKRGPGSTHPDSAKSDGVPLDVAWDDDTLPGFSPGDSIFDRVTTIPEIPLEVQAKRMMDLVHDNDDPVSGTFERNGEMPPDAAELLLDLEALSSIAPPLNAAHPATEPSPAGSSLELETPQPPAPNRDAMPGEFELELADGRSKLAGSLAEIKDRYAMGDYSGALVAAESILEAEPAQPDALRYAHRCRQVLMDMYTARIGLLTQVATVAVPPDQIRWLSLDHRAGFLLSLIDGHSTLDEVLDISGMPRLDALRILFSLIEERVITLFAKNP
jgi:hypothetical protein